MAFYRLLGDALSDESTLVIETCEYDVISIDQKLMSSSNHDKPMDEQLSFFIMIYMDYMTDILSSRFSDLPYTKKDSMIKSILEAMDEENIPKVKKQEMIELIKNIPEDTNIFTWLTERDTPSKNGTPSHWVNLICNRVQPVCISDSFDGTDEFPNICTLVENGCYAP